MKPKFWCGEYSCTIWCGEYGFVALNHWCLLILQNQIDKISDSVADRQSRIAWKTVSDVSRWKSTAKAKLKATSQQERILIWKQHFDNLLGNLSKVTHEPITRIVSKQLDIKIGQFTQEELDPVLRKIKNRNQQGFMKYSQKYERPGNSTTYCSGTVMLYIIKTQ